MGVEKRIYTQVVIASVNNNRRSMEEADNEITAMMDDGWEILDVSVVVASDPGFGSGSTVLRITTLTRVRRTAN
jgi:hypothetical protein